MKWIKPIFVLALYAPYAVAFDILDHEINPPWIDKAKPQRFSVCFNHSCKQTANIGLKQNQWKKVQALFKKKAKNAAQERKRIAKAISMMEKFVGPLINTSNDKAYNFRGMLADGNQQDCVDESTNSTTYLTMMEQEGMLQFHKVRTTSTRGWFITGLPHTTAVIRDTKSGADYAVDSWFHDNGVEPEIIPLSLWFKGWDPEKDKRP